MDGLKVSEFKDVLAEFKFIEEMEDLAGNQELGFKWTLLIDYLRELRGNPGLREAHRIDPIESLCSLPVDFRRGREVWGDTKEEMLDNFLNDCYREYNDWFEGTRPWPGTDSVEAPSDAWE